MWINGPQFLYYSESKLGKFISYNNTCEGLTNIRSNENDVSSLTNVHVKPVRNLKEVFSLKTYKNFDQLIHVTFFVYRGIFNSRVKKPSYKTVLCIMMSQTELITLKFYFFQLVTQCEESFNIIFKLVIRDF